MVEYTTINPVYEEGRTMNKIVCLFIIFLMILL